jgi:hypothetical protein
MLKKRQLNHTECTVQKKQLSLHYTVTYKKDFILFVEAFTVGII